MKSQLTIKNFGPIQKAELDIRKTTVFIGPQGSGKSVLAKLIAVFKTIESLEEKIDESKLQVHCKYYEVHNFFQDETTLQFTNNSTRINFSQKKIAIKRKTSREYEEVGLKQRKIQKLKAKEKLYEMFRSIAEETATTKELLTEIKKTIEVVIRNEPLIKHIYIPTERMLIAAIDDALFSFINNQIPVSKCISGFGNYFEIARKKIPVFYSDILGVTYKFENGRNMVYINDNQGFLLSQSASGYQSVLPLQVAIEYHSQENTNLFVVEEPELNLYPATQKKLIYYLAKKCPELVITTHSPYTLAAFNNLLFAYQASKTFPALKEAIAQIIPEEYWINPEDFNAYHIEDGQARSIFDREMGMIEENELDGISEDLGEEFDSIMELYRTQNRAKK